MKPTILLTGKTGQIGLELSRTLVEIGNVVSLDRTEFNLLNPKNMRDVIRSLHPQLIVNTAAYTAVDKAESEPETAKAINTDAPGLMAEESKKIGAILVHYSTDYVFDGSRDKPYTESDHANPKNVYGKTKLEGEEAIRHSGVSHLIFRTEWVYGRVGKNFLLTILRLATDREELRIVSDQIGAPTWSREIARGTTRALAKLFQSSNAPNAIASLAGTYHMTASGETTWFHFAQAILEEASRPSMNVDWVNAATSGKAIITRRVIPISTIDYPTPATRPSYSILSNDKFAETFALRLPDWRTQLRSVFGRGD